MRSLALGVLSAACLASLAGCERRAEEVRPEPVALARPAPRPPAREGAEHGQDPRRAADALPPARPAPRDDAEAPYPELADGDGEGEVDEDAARDARPAKRRRSGGVATSAETRAQSEVLRAKRLVVARGVDGREPVGVARSFDAAEVDEVAVFVELGNDAREATTVTVRFEPPQGSAFDVELDVGPSPRWRTWATTRRPLVKGSWGVRVLDASGALVGRTTFEVSE